MKTMGRFGLRRGFKLSEEQQQVNGKNPIGPTATAAPAPATPRKKRQPRQEEVPATTEEQRSSEDQNSQQQHQQQQQRREPLSLICSLPLERLPRLMEKLQQLTEERERERERLEREREREREEASALSAGGHSKVLCLYCDRKFTSGKLQAKHVDKFHTERQERRCSGRSTSSNAQSAVGGFPGCHLCHLCGQQASGKRHQATPPPQICLPAKHLEQLFQHLSEQHADKYFGCRQCRLRFPDADQLAGHQRQQHQPIAPPEEAKPGLMGADEPVLFRLGLTQNRLPSHRNRSQRKEEEPPPQVSKSRSSSRAAAQRQQQQLQQQPAPAGNHPSQDTVNADAVFRLPASSACLNATASSAAAVASAAAAAASSVFDDNFYKDVVLNVRHNLQNHLDGRLLSSPATTTGSGRGTELIMLHGPSQLSPGGASYPTLLTAEQFGGPGELLPLAKFRRRPHTKHSWKWKWDYVKKFTLINEGGRLVKKLKPPSLGLGLRDLSKLDMWTQLTMRQKHDLSEHEQQNQNQEQRRLLEQLNLILDHRLLPHIILEQNEQAVIKCEQDEGDEEPLDSPDLLTSQSFADESFLSLLQLQPRTERQRERDQERERERERERLRSRRGALVLSGEWARPRLYLCICCGAKFDQRKSLEEHKTFRHSHIYATHYEVVGRELLAGNLLRHLFIPKRALGRFAAASNCAVRWPQIAAPPKQEQEQRVQPEEETRSSASSRSSYEVSTPTLEQQQPSPAATSSSSCSPSSSSASTLMSTCISSASTSSSSAATTTTSLSASSSACSSSSSAPSSCTKCGRKCSGLMDLYRHMLDCSGDYVWSLAKKRKYRYYCGTKKRRGFSKKPLKQRKKEKQEVDEAEAEAEAEGEHEGDPDPGDGEESGCSSSKMKNSPRQRPSDAESIRKMLENLPAKRVCKKIFPVDNKAKRKAKNKAKAKSMAKSLAKSKQQRSSTKRIYNQHLLRSTRSRSRSSVMATASSASAVAAQQQRSRRKQKQQQQKAKLDRVKSPPAAPAEPLSEQAKPPAPTVTAKSRSPAEEKPALRLELPSLPLPPPPEAAAVAAVPSSEPASPTPSSKQLMPTPPTTPAPATKSPPAAAVAPPFGPNSRLPPATPNSSVKRSKRISDCIAMLTGKLEEKLKTEQVQPQKEREKEKEKEKEMIEQEKQPEPLAAAQEKEKEKEKEKELEKEPLQPKTPKRKAVSRRIIKVDAPPEPVIEALPALEHQQQLTGAVTPLPVAAAATPLLPVTPPAALVATALPVPVPVPATAAVLLPLPPAPEPALTPAAAPVPPPIAAPPPRRTPTKAAAKQMAAPPTKPPPSLAALKQYPAPPQQLPVPVPPQPVLVQVPLGLQAMPAPAPLPVPVPVPVPVPPLNVKMMSKLPLYMPQMQPQAQAQPQPSAMFVMDPQQPLNLTSQRGMLLQKPPDPGFVPHHPHLHQQQPQHRASGMPARRQTICGFEARNLLAVDMDMDLPLDLSKKSSRKSSPVPPAMPLQLAPPALPMPLPLPLVTGAGGAPPQQAPPPPTAATAPMPLPLPGQLQSLPLVASQYYSNLDLLKIPQVRNPNPVGVASNVPQPLPVAPVTVVGPPPPALMLGATKAAGKKRSQEGGTASSKKEHGKGQAKACARMDEVVNNHIDDAINSVIMAVQASLPDDDEDEAAAEREKEAEKQRERDKEKLKKLELELEAGKPGNCLLPLQANPGFLFGLPPAPPAAHLAPVAPLAPVPAPLPASVPAKNLTPKKRSMRSRTIDCRAALLALDEAMPPAVPCLPLPVNGDARREVPPMEVMPQPEQALTAAPLPPELGLKEVLLEKPVLLPPPEEPEPEPKPERQPEPEPEPVIVQPQPQQLEEEEEEAVPAPVPVSVISVAPAQPQAPRLATPPPETTNCSSSLMEEHSSNLNNNTSSGFHSLAQSEQPITTTTPGTEEQLPVLAEAAKAAVVPEPVEEPKASKEEEQQEQQEPVKQKKQRRRRKNELAAIVADQLLESFKIDNARRDNLKKLENLAYEKSEDLLLTGMLLMSSTKRNAALGPAAKLAKNEAAQPPARGRPKRRQSCYYRRGKGAADKAGAGGKATNENISLLKSSLESFSIGIEKQLLAKEAARESQREPATPTQPPVSSILRPSILSSAVAREQQREQQRKQQQEKPPAAAAPTFSRDPRLNKNIHKEAPPPPTEVKETPKMPQPVPPPPPGDNPEEEDNYLTEIAKNVNEKIMSATTNEDFEFAHDEFDGEDPDQDQDQDKYYRPPTSMSVRSAPNLNDEHSNFGSMCDDNTNTEVMDMDLDDEMSVYTSYSQDLGRGGRGRRRRRRRSVLLTRRPKKRTQRSELDAEKYGCKLCGKAFFTATSLSKHNMTLAHVSKVSAQEYLQSQTAPSSPQREEDREQEEELRLMEQQQQQQQQQYQEYQEKQQQEEQQPPPPAAAAAAAPQQMRASVLMVTSQLAQQEREMQRELQLEREQHQRDRERERELAQLEASQVHHVITEASLRLHDLDQHSPTAPSAARLNLNPDERLFYECCNILKSAETPRQPGSGITSATSVIVSAGRKHPLPPPASPSPSPSPSPTRSLPPPASPSPSPSPSRSGSLPPPASPSPEPMVAPIPPPAVCHQPVIQQLFRNPPAVTPTTTPTNHNRLSPSYSAVSQFSATTTTSRFKTKAAMKGYENVNLQLDMLELAKAGRGVCKLTELADIALGSEKPGGDYHLPPPTELAAVPPPSAIQRTPTPTVTPTPTPSLEQQREQQSSTSSKTIMHASIIKAAASSATLPPVSGRIIIPDRPFKNIGLEEKAPIQFQKPKTCVNLLQEQDNNSVSTASYSDRDDYDFGTLSCDGDVEPEPEPEAPVRVAAEAGRVVLPASSGGNRAVSTSSSSSSSSSSAEQSRSANGGGNANRSRSSSSSSSRATAKTFENKSLIMGRIFKHASSAKASAAAMAATAAVPGLAKIKALPKNQANLDQIFDELRGGSAAKATEMEAPPPDNWERHHPQQQQQHYHHPHHHQVEPMAAPAAPAAPAAMPAPSALPPGRKAKTAAGNAAKKGGKTQAPPPATPTPTAAASPSGSSTSSSRKPRKDLTKLQSELGMSHEEIEQLIDEGQRKSKRRCATNRPKKLVETWSSDEYEEFLSTKDIIALIEQKEQQELRRKRKTSEANSQPEAVQPAAVGASRKAPQATPQAMATPKRKNRANEKKQQPPEPVEQPKPRARQRNQPVQAPAPPPPEAPSAAPPARGKAKAMAKGKAATAAATKAGNSRKKRVNEKLEEEQQEEELEKAETESVEPPTRTRSSRQQPKNRAEPEILQQQQPPPPQELERMKAPRQSNPSQPPAPAQPHLQPRTSSVATATTNNNNNSSSSNKNLKTKRRSQTNRQSPARRKRPATEKQLYYWSSSSDDEFGRLEAEGEAAASASGATSAAGGDTMGSERRPDRLELEPEEEEQASPSPGKHFEENEPYQKHGWIVGDSHKKLVKLLAIAKGSKKVDNCGVKRRTPKRKC